MASRKAHVPENRSDGGEQPSIQEVIIDHHPGGVEIHEATMETGGPGHQNKERKTQVGSEPS